MATVTLDVSTDPVLEYFQPLYPDPSSPLPRAKVIFENDTVIPLLGAADVNVITGTFTLPKGYAYLLNDARFRIDMPSQGDLSDFERCAGYTFTCNGIVRRTGQIPSASFYYYTSDGQIVQNPSVTDNWSNYYEILPMDKVLSEIQIGGMNGDVVFQYVIVDALSTTAAGSLRNEISFWQFTQDQALKSALHFVSNFT